MKNYLILGFMLAVLFISPGCKKDKDSNSEKPYFSVKIEDVTWASNDIESFYKPATNLTIVIAYSSDLREHVSLAFTGSEPGTYLFDGSDLNNFAQYNSISDLYGYSTLFANTLLGQVVISTYDKTSKTISGTFYFEGFNQSNEQKSFTEGTFSNVKYIIE